MARLPGKRRALSLPGVKTLLAPMLFSKMYWSVWDYITAASASNDTHSIRLSSIYDPGYSWSLGTKNTSSRGYTVISPLYSYYRVYGVKVFVKVWNVSNCDCLVQLTSNSSTGPSNTSNADLVDRQEGSVSRLLSRQSAGNASSATTFKLWVPMATVQGLTKEQYRTNASTESAMGTSPALNAYLHLTCWNIHVGGYDGLAGENVAQLGDSAAQVSSTTGAVGYSLRMIQSVQFMRRVAGANL